MAVEMNPTMNTNYVRINLGDDNTQRYYVVKKDKADSFTSAYKKQAQKTSILTNTVFLGSILGGTFLSLYATRSIKSSLLRWVLNCAGGVAAGMASLPLTGKYAKAKEDKIVAKYGARPEK
jgi:hypothetical protein